MFFNMSLYFMTPDPLLLLPRQEKTHLHGAKRPGDDAADAAAGDPKHRGRSGEQREPRAHTARPHPLLRDPRHQRDVLRGPGGGASGPHRVLLGGSHMAAPQI